MSMVGYTCGFITWYPTDDEIEKCQHITLSNEYNWDPSTNISKMSSIDEEQRSNVFNLRSINQMRSKTPCATPVTYIQDDMTIHKFDWPMVNVSIGLAQDLMVDRIIVNITVSMTKKGYATIKNERRHLVTSELLARKWGIGLENAKETLKATTQECIRSALLPLTRRYRTYLISQRLRRISRKFYTDTLFEKHKSIIGNTCAQIFTDWEGLFMFTLCNIIQNMEKIWM